jgi:uncharacterized protein (TIGR02145 family)
MKLFSFIITLLLLTNIRLSAQSGMTIRSGGAVTVQGNTTIVPCSPPSAPLTGTHVSSATQIIWNWHTVSGATGYKWNTINDFSSAVDLGTQTTKTELGLTCNTSYSRYVWAINECGPSDLTILNQVTSACPWICGSLFTDPRDSKIYSTVMIGTQCWMAQNLNYGTRINSSAEQNNNGIPEKYCSNNLESNCDIYGGLYEWAEMVQYLNGATNGTSWNPVPLGNVQGICPSGWYLPKDADWTVLSTFLGGSATAGGKMKETGTTHWTAPNTNATNSSGFTGLPGGFRDSYGGTFGLNSYGDFWSAEEYYWDTAWQASLGFNSEDLFHQGNYTKKYGVSVRCLKD